MKRRRAGRGLCAAVALIGALCALPSQSRAGAIGYVGSAGWGVAGFINDLSCITCVQTWTSPFSVTLADGLVVSGIANETFTQVGGFTTSAYERITNIAAINTGLGPVTDNVYFFSDAFSPSLPGTAGVGIVGYYGAAGILGPTGGFYSASSQAQMNYLFAPVFGFVGAPGFSLTTPGTFATCAPCLNPFFFFEAARGVSAGGVVQLVGGINFTLAAGSEIYLPGSVIIDDNDPSVYQSEVPEPTTFAGLGGGLIALAWIRRRGRKR